MIGSDAFVVHIDKKIRDDGWYSISRVLLHFASSFSQVEFRILSSFPSYNKNIKPGFKSPVTTRRFFFQSNQYHIYINLCMSVFECQKKKREREKEKLYSRGRVPIFKCHLVCDVFFFVFARLKHFQINF